MSVPLNFIHLRLRSRLFESVPGRESFGGDKISLIAWSLSPRTKLRLSVWSCGHKQVCRPNTDWIGTPSRLRIFMLGIRAIIHDNCRFARMVQSRMRCSGWRRTIAISKLADNLCSEQFILRHNDGSTETCAHVLHTSEQVTSVSCGRYLNSDSNNVWSRIKLPLLEGGGSDGPAGRTGKIGFFRCLFDEWMICWASCARSAFFFRGKLSFLLVSLLMSIESIDMLQCSSSLFLRFTMLRFGVGISWCRWWLWLFPSSSLTFKSIALDDAFGFFSGSSSESLDMAPAVAPHLTCSFWEWWLLVACWNSGMLRWCCNWWWSSAVSWLCLPTSDDFWRARKWRG